MELVETAQAAPKRCFAAVTACLLPAVSCSLESKLEALRKADPEEFDRVAALVQYRAREPRPLFPKATMVSTFVSSIPKIDPDKVEAFKAEMIDGTYHHDEEAAMRMKSLVKIRDAQYARWKWVCANVSTYVNMLRVCGHSDDNIQAMFAGRPLCFREQKTYDELCVALRALKAKLEEEMGWESVGFVFTGSSVPGFSQNPAKGKHLVPSKITSVSKSDVDISLKADGVEKFVEAMREKGISCRGYPTTCTPTKAGMRFGMKPKDLCEQAPALENFYKEWSARLPGGLQLTLCDDGLSVPPWEARVDMRG